MHNKTNMFKGSWFMGWNHASEFGESSADLNWRSTTFETNHLELTTVKCQSSPKFLVNISSTIFVLINGCGPLDEMKLSFSAFSSLSGRSLV